MNGAAHPIKKILVIRTDRFGEFLLIMPALRALKQKFEGAQITAMVNPAVVELAGCVPFIDKVIPWNTGKHSWSEKIKFAFSLRKHAFDLVIVFNPHKESHLISFLAGIPARVGYSRKCGFLLTQRIEDRKHRAEKHEIEYNLDLVRLLGVDTVDKTLSLRLNNGIISSLPEAASLKTQQPVIAVHPFTSDPVKQWPFENFKQLIHALTKESDVKVVVVGGLQECCEHQAFLRGIATHNVINLAGKTTLPQLAWLLSCCNVLVSADSGPVHLASSVGVPVIALFRSDLPGKIFRRWGPVSPGSRVLEADNLDDIKVEAVLELCRKVLKR